MLAATVCAVCALARLRPTRANIAQHHPHSRAQAKKDAREVAAINRHAAQLNAKMSDALSFQAGATDE
jgi:hypothetical protein